MSGTGAAGTIFALASGSGRAGVAVLRVSGPEAGPSIRELTGGPVPPPRQAALRRIGRDDGDRGAPIDRGLVLWFPAPNSFTGEDVAEFHVHGGPALVAALLKAFAAIPGLRPAEPGEFTRRAFETGKLDLAQAEGLADVIAAETEAQRRQAMRQMDGGLSALYDRWRDRLIEAAALIEADIDFPDEEDVPLETASGAIPLLASLRDEIEAHLADRRGQRLREGVTVAILGAPNAGKSSLLNALARRDVAIVSHIPGTTRDVVEISLDIGGVPVSLADTAGLRETAEQIEAEGIRRALARAEAADLRLCVFDAAAADPWPGEVTARAEADAVVVVNKIDLAPLPALPEFLKNREILEVSAAAGTGIGRLEATLAARVRDLAALTEAPALTRERHRHFLAEAAEHVARAVAADQAPLELVAEDVRLAARAVGRITGRVDVEDLLDRIFSDFCIGK